MKPRFNCLAEILSIMSGGNQAPLITCPIPSQRWSMVVAASCCGNVFQQQWVGDWSGLRESWTAEYKMISLYFAQDVRLGRRFTFQQGNDPKHTDKTMQEQLRDNSVNVLAWPSQSPDLNPIKHLWTDLKMAVHRRSPSNLTELERICREEWQKIHKFRCAKLVASYPRRLKAVITAKDASTKYWVKVWIFMSMWYFSFSFLINLQKFLKSCFCFVITGYWV